MVFNKRITKNKNILLEVEDLTGRALLLVNSNKEEVFKKAQEIVLDDILGFKCSGNNEMLFVNDIIIPDVFLKEKKKSPYEESAIFIADLHVGSNKFLEKQFLEFIDWVNLKVGGEKHQKIASTVKYIFILGDLVDGIGIYPGQEDELVIKEVTAQYEKVAELLSKIRDDIKIIICPGNHDAVRIAEPQPLLDERFAAALYDLKNAIFVSNPCVVGIGGAGTFPGFNVLAYHGYSFEHYASNVDVIRLNSPSKRPDVIMEFLLKRRHLAPTHSSTPYVPCEKQDPLAIYEAPDIFVSAHMHKSSISSHNGILNIACSCWQSTTPYQEKIGHEPDPCKVPILNLKTGQVNVIDFSS
jgi:DNA polymerase II small subunit